MLDQLRQIAIFARTVDHGSFRAAAQALNVSPSVVSHHIAQLEERLGTALLYRSTRKLSLTEDGRRLLAHAHEMVDAAEAGLRAVSARSRQPTGVLNVTVPAVLAQSDLVDRIAAFSTDFPGIELHLDFSDQRRDIISAGMDLAIRMGTMADSALVARRLYEVQRTLVAARTYLDERGAPDHPDQLVDWNWLSLGPAQKKTVFHGAGRRQVTLSPRPGIRVNDAHALFRLARAGAGIAIVPEFLVRSDIAAGAMARVLPEWSVAPVGVHAVWPPNSPKDGLTSRFVRYLAA